MYMDSIQTCGPTLSIDTGSDIPIVQQIIGGLRRALLDGQLRPGDSLPSSRALGRDLGVHFNTVAQAYRVLESEGWLALRRRSGTVVLDRSRPELTAQEMRKLAADYVAALSDLLAAFEARGLDRTALERLTRNTLDPDRSMS